MYEDNKDYRLAIALTDEMTGEQLLYRSSEITFPEGFVDEFNSYLFRLLENFEISLENYVKGEGGDITYEE